MNASSPRASRQTPKEKKGPYTLPCGCNALGVCCPQEKALGGALDQARAAWLQSGTRPGDARFPLFYRPLLDARLDYHAHFGQRYFPDQDGLWRDQLAARAVGGEKSMTEKSSMKERQ